MRNLFEGAAAAEVNERIERLTPDSQRLWGKMSVAQMMAHCSIAMEWAIGDAVPPRMFAGRILGRFVKPLALGDDKPLRRNSPTAKTLIIADEREMNKERDRLRGLIARFVAAGPKGCTTHPHSFFGRLTPEEWAILAYKHLDHHLRQFGV